MVKNELLMCVWQKLKSQRILLFNFFLVLFINLTVLFGIIHGFQCTISTNLYIYLQYFQQKIFNFSKISGFQTHHLVCVWLQIKKSAYFTIQLIFVTTFGIIHGTHCIISSNFYFYL